MKVYKRGAWSLTKSLGLAIAGPVLLALVLSWLFTNPLIVFGIPAAILLWLLYMSVFSENIRIELDGDLLRYFKSNKLKAEYYLPECSMRLKRLSRRSGATTDYHHYLYITRLSGEQQGEESIDCTPLGYSKSEDLFSQLKGQLDFGEDVRLEAAPK